MVITQLRLLVKGSEWFDCDAHRLLCLHLFIILLVILFKSNLVLFHE